MVSNYPQLNLQLKTNQINENSFKLILVDWNNVYRPSTIAKIHVHSKLNRNVTLLRLFPSITVETVSFFLMQRKNLLNKIFFFPLK